MARLRFAHTISPSLLPLPRLKKSALALGLGLAHTFERALPNRAPLVIEHIATKTSIQRAQSTRGKSLKATVRSEPRCRPSSRETNRESGYVMRRIEVGRSLPQVLG